MKVDSYKCDVCGGAKGEGNKWLIGVPVDSGGIDRPLARILMGDEGLQDIPTIKGYTLLGWEDGIAESNSETVHHLCSEKCAFTRQAEYIR